MEKINKITIIGSGAMGSAFAKGIIASELVKAENVTLVDVDKAKLNEAKSQLGVTVSSDADSAIKNADVVLLAVKPGIVKSVLAGIRNTINPQQLVISIAAGVKIETIESGLPAGIGVIRVMPNTPCQIGAGAIGFSRGSAVNDNQVEIAKSIFNVVGISFEVPEKLLDAVTGLSGSGPAYIYILIEALSDAGVRVGLPRDVALQLSAQTVLGSARMVLESGKHPGQLKDQVTSPGGTTIAGVDVLEKAGFRSALIEAVKAGTARSEELG